MNRNARRRIEAVREQAERERRDAEYRARCEKDGLTAEQRFNQSMGILADVARVFCAIVPHPQYVQGGDN